MNCDNINFSGHAVKGNTNIDSDIDLAIGFENFSDTFDMQVQLMKLRENSIQGLNPMYLENPTLNHPILLLRKYLLLA